MQALAAQLKEWLIFITEKRVSYVLQITNTVVPICYMVC